MLVSHRWATCPPKVVQLKTENIIFGHLCVRIFTGLVCHHRQSTSKSYHPPINHQNQATLAQHGSIEKHNVESFKEAQLSSKFLAPKRSANILKRLFPPFRKAWSCTFRIASKCPDQSAEFQLTASVQLNSPTSWIYIIQFQNVVPIQLPVPWHIT